MSASSVRFFIPPTARFLFGVIFFLLHQQVGSVAGWSYEGSVGDQHYFLHSGCSFFGSPPKCPHGVLAGECSCVVGFSLPCRLPKSWRV